MALILLFKPKIWTLLIIVSLMTAVFSVRSGKNTKETAKNVIINGSLLLILVLVWRTIGARGLLGLLSAVIIVVAIIIYRRRKLFIKTIRDIELLIWGKTNDRSKGLRKKK
jgi:O-antigen ligase